MDDVHDYDPLTLIPCNSLTDPLPLPLTVIGTLYCAKGNFEFGISRIIKVSLSTPSHCIAHCHCCC